MRFGPRSGRKQEDGGHERVEAEEEEEGRTSQVGSHLAANN